MRRRDSSTAESDSHDLLFGADEDFYSSEAPANGERISRREAREDRETLSRHGRRRHGGRVVWIMLVILAVVVAAATWLVVLPVYHYFSPSDYAGAGTGSVIVEVQPNDGASQIGATLAGKDVVASARAFANAADDNPDSQNIQPGSYRMRSHMSASAAVSLLLSPSSRVDADAAVPEGATVYDVEKRLVLAPCKSKSTTVCGPGLSRAKVLAAVGNVKALGLPTDFRSHGRTPTSVEGFLYPATYYFPEQTTATAALQQMVTKFTDQARNTNFTAQAKRLGLTPYQELIIASIAQSEAKFPQDYAKVARVILNRLRINKPLQIDATSVYGANVKGLDPSKVIYSEVDSPYNTYRNNGLTPTPISNPGPDAMDGAAHPANGNWTYYVNGDAAGHLFFTNNEAVFAQAVAKCKANNWGCG